MEIRPIRSDELDLFTRIGAKDDHHHSAREYIERLIPLGVMRPGWCFVADDGGKLVGRTAFWALPGADSPHALVLMDIPWEPTPGSVGRQLLADVLGRARDLGATRIEHVVDSPAQPPQWQDDWDQRIALLDATGFVMRRETRRFELLPETVPTPAPERAEALVYRSTADAGDEALIEALELVTTGTLDQRLRDDSERHGTRQGAVETLAELRQLEHEPDWWELAYLPSGALAGLVMPARIPTATSIGYIGVVPEQRGKGHIHALLSRGTETLRNAGATRIVADTDVSNIPMANAFLRAGWHEFAQRREYDVDLTDRRSRSP